MYNYRSLPAQSQLLFLIIITVQCGAIEYYVKPTENVSCPSGHPCLTINQYTDPSTNYLELNNTVFTFLPGIHIIERPIELNNVENIILQSMENNDEYPQLIPSYTYNDIVCYSQSIQFPNTMFQIPCCCSIIQIKDVVNVTVTRLKMIASHNISGITILDSSTVQVIQSIISSNSEHMSGIGIFIRTSTCIAITSLNIQGMGFGMLQWNVDNVIVQNSSFQDCLYYGIYMLETNSIKLLNIIVGNSMHGIMLCSTRFSSLENVLMTLNGIYGVYLDECAHTTMMNLSLIDNSGGLYVGSSSNTSIQNTSILNNKDYSSILVEMSINTIMRDIVVSSTKFYIDLIAICILFSNNTILMNVKTMSVRYLYSGIVLFYSENTTLSDIISSSNELSSIEAINSNNTTMINILSMNNLGFGIYFMHSDNNVLINVTSMNNRDAGIRLENAKTTRMINVSSINNQHYGYFIVFSLNTEMITILSLNNQRDGINVLYCNDTIMMHISSENNEDDGIYVEASHKTTLINVSSVNNMKNGISIEYSTNTTMIDMLVSSLNNQYAALHVEYSSETTMINTLTVRNKDTSSVTSFKSVLFLRSCSNAHIMNLSMLVDKDIEQSAISFFDCTDITLEENTFSGLMSDVETKLKVTDLPAVIDLYNTKLNLKNCNFTNNRISSISSKSSNITVEQNLLFENISAISGAAFIVSRSVLIISELSNVVFCDNVASEYGGVFYIVDDELAEISIELGDLVNSGTSSFITYGSQCFIQMNGTRSDTAHLTFINNTAVEGGDVVYGGLVASGYDGDWNCLHSFKNISDMTYQTSVRQITSSPSRVCLCHDHFPDCLIVADPTPRTLYPGETLTISAALVGQDFGTVSGDVYAYVMNIEYNNNISVETDQLRVRYDNGECKHFVYTLYSSCEKCEAVLVLTADGRSVSQVMNITDNHKLNKSWSILQSQPDYHAIASEYIQKLISVNITRDEGDVHDFFFLSGDYDDVINSVINNFFTLTPENINLSLNGENLTLSNKLHFPKQIYSYPLYITIQFHPCPLGFTLSQFQCDCNQLLQHMPRVDCDIQYQTITRTGLIWVGVDGNNTVAVSQYCPFNYCKNQSVEFTLVDTNSTGPDSQCNYKHSGILCGGCQPGLSLALGSEQCLHCSNAYISLILAFVLAGLLLVLFIKVLNFTVCHGTINGLIFYANIISANKHIYYNQSDINPITLFISWFNLDFGIEVCFYDGLTAYARTWLQFLFPIYIWCIAGAIITLANNSKRVAVISGNNGVPVLSTLFLLSYAKLFNTIISVISYTTLYTTQGQRLVWTIDGNIDYLGPEHAPLFAVAVIVLLFLWLPYTLIILFGKYLHKMNCRLIARYLLKLKPFLDANYAPFNDRHQYWFGIILLVKAAILLSSATIPANGAHIVVFCVSILALALTFWGNVVFENTKNMLFHTFFLFNLCALNITKLFVFDSMHDMTIASNALIGIVLIQFLGVCLGKIVKLSQVKLSDHNIICCRRNREEDDWEPFMLAALQREEESESDEDSHSSESMESLPTYPLV